MRTEEISDLYDDRQAAMFGRGRRFALAAFALACVVVVAVVAIVSRSSSGAPAQLRVRGDAISVKHGSSDFRAAQEGEDLRAGDEVRSNASGRAQIEFFDSSVVRIDGDTHLALRRVVDDASLRDIALEVTGGRTWNRVSELTSDRDRFEVRMPNAVARVRGTTFMVDCRQQVTCYVVGFDGRTELESTTGAEEVVGDGDCVRVAADGLSTCDEKSLGLLDAWVNENLADDQQLALRRAPSTPRATPEETSDATLAPVPQLTRPRPRPPARAPAAQPTPTPTPIATRTPTPEPTPEDTPIPTRSPRPRRTKSPDPQPTACPTGEDGIDCGDGGGGGGSP
jgi:hypothetical protein